MSHAQKDPHRHEAMQVLFWVLAFSAGFTFTALRIPADVPPATRTLDAIFGGIVGMVAFILLAAVTQRLWDRDE